MSEKSVYSVSAISEATYNGKLFCFGFTVTYTDGEISNFIIKSEKENNKALLKALQKERQKFLQKISEKEKRK